MEMTNIRALSGPNLTNWTPRVAALDEKMFAFFTNVRLILVRRFMPVQDYNILDVIDRIADDINNVLDDRETENYFASIILLYSFIENLLIWLVYAKLLWNRAGRNLSKKDVVIIRNWCN